MDFLEILKLGSPGVFFLLVLLTYRLLANEQKKAEPHKNMITAIFVFMVFCVLFGIANLVVELKNTLFVSKSNLCDNTAISKGVVQLSEAHNKRILELNKMYDTAYAESTPGSHLDSYIDGYKAQMKKIEALIASENASFLEKSKALESLKCKEISHNKVS